VYQEKVEMEKIKYLSIVIANQKIKIFVYSSKDSIITSISFTFACVQVSYFVAVKKIESVNYISLCSICMLKKIFCNSAVNTQFAVISQFLESSPLSD
jgi:hypothetical protein